MYKQVYLHHIRRVYDIHLKDFLTKWLKGGKFSTDLNKHMNISDVEVLVAIRKAYENKQSSQHVLARRIQCREHFRLFYEAAPSDARWKIDPRKSYSQSGRSGVWFGSNSIRPHSPQDGSSHISSADIRWKDRVVPAACMPEIGVDSPF